MEERESILLGVNSNDNREIQRGAYYTSPSTPNRNSEEDVDFNDVFGGPPRRSSANEKRHSLSPGRMQPRDLSGDDDGGGGGGKGPSCPWPPENEKPVFGEDNGNRRRYPNRSNDFFDDIFGGDESPTPTTRKHDRDPFSGRVLSPARPLPSPAESFASSPLPSSAFSLPAKWTKGMDLPTFGSSTRSMNPLNNINNGAVTSNGSSGSSDSHLSRFSPQAATKQKEESKNDSKPSYRQSLLSKEFSDKESNMKQDQQPISEVLPSNGNGQQFHFSIYKWASKGVPMVMPPTRAERKDKFKIERCSSAKDWIVSDITTKSDSPIAHSASSFRENRKQDGSAATYTTIPNSADSIQIVEQIASAKVQPDTLSSLQTVIKDGPGSPISTVIKDGPGSPISTVARAESSTHSVSEVISFSGKTVAACENQTLEYKSLRFFLSDEKQDYDEITRRERRELRKTISTKKPSAIFDVNVNAKTRVEEKTVSLAGVEHSKAASRDSLSLGENTGKKQVKGKVKDFVQMFNQEAVAKPRVDSKSQGSTYKPREALRTKNEVEGYPEQSKKGNSQVGTVELDSSYVSTNDLSREDDISEPAIPDISFDVIGDKDQSFHEKFTIDVLDEDENEDLQKKDNQEIQVIDNKIQQWSKGKEGNIRSLLSTLQYVLWTESGWKPVPLMDIIEGNSVKRAYQRALLCLHPDKLQQKGVGSDKKYIAEKVFDILQEAWSQFNMIGAL